MIDNTGGISTFKGRSPADAGGIKSRSDFITGSKEEFAMAEKIKTRTRRILVVEEDESIRTVLSTFLSKAGYEVMTARSGEEGMDFLVNGSIDLVLSDLSMSGMNGWTFAWAVKSKSPRTPVGLMTGWDEQEITARMKGSAVDFVMFKPFRFSEMLKTVERILEEKP